MIPHLYFQIILYYQNEPLYKKRDQKYSLLTKWNASLFNQIFLAEAKIFENNTKLSQFLLFDTKF